MLKKTGDGKTPGVNKDLFPYFENMRHRPPLTFSEYVKIKGLTVPDGINKNNLTPVMVGGGEAYTVTNGNDDQQEDEWIGAPSASFDVKPASLASSVATELGEAEVANLLLAFSEVSENRRALICIKVYVTLGVRGIRFVVDATMS